MIEFAPVIEVYITNICNLACRGCNRFNNYNFKGHQYWETHATEMEAWAQRITSPKITIIGGEPTLNPDLETWASNLRRLWPDSTIMVQTNGTYIRPNFATFWGKYEVGFTISLHDRTTADSIKQTWKDLGFPIEAFIFRQAAVINNNGHYKVHNSTDITLAFGACDMKYDHTLSNGKLYKCPTMSTLPDFVEQFNVDLTPRQQELLSSYQPLSADCSDEELVLFANTREHPIEQCEFCPENLKWYYALGPDDSEQPPPVL